MFGLYRKTEEMREGRSVYMQMHDTMYEDRPRKLFSDRGVWTISWDDDVYLRAATPSESPTSVTWKYMEYSKNKWHDDPALIVAGLTEKPDYCEVTISLSQGKYIRKEQLTQALNCSCISELNTEAFTIKLIINAQYLALIYSCNSVPELVAPSLCTFLGLSEDVKGYIISGSLGWRACTRQMAHTAWGGWCRRYSVSLEQVSPESVSS